MRPPYGRRMIFGITVLVVVKYLDGFACLVEHLQISRAHLGHIGVHNAVQLGVLREGVFERNHCSSGLHQTATGTGIGDVRQLRGAQTQHGFQSRTVDSTLREHHHDFGVRNHRATGV